MFRWAMNQFWVFLRMLALMELTSCVAYTSPRLSFAPSFAIRL